MCKKSQIWSLDLIAGVTAFVFIMTIYFIFTGNIADNNKSNFDEIYNDIGVLSDTLLSEGSPANWSADSVEEVGLTNGAYRLNISKLKNISSLDYSTLKVLLKTRYNYLIFFENKSHDVIEINGLEYIGKLGLTKENIMEQEEPETLVTIKRFMIYGPDIITMVVYSWE